MERKRLFATAAVTVMLAIGAGHLMQYGLTPTASEISNNPPPRPSSLRHVSPPSTTSSILMQGAEIEGELTDGFSDDMKIPDRLKLTSVGSTGN